MKSVQFLSLFVVMITAGCQPKVQDETMDLNAIEKEVASFMDGYHDAFNSRNIDGVTTILADDGLFCGTDPSEIMDKKGLSDMIEQAISDSTMEISYSLNVRKIKIAEDGKSAIVMEHASYPGWSPKIQVRNTFHLVQHENNWMIDYIGWGFIPRNEDIVKLNDALE